MGILKKTKKSDVTATTPKTVNKKPELAGDVLRRAIVSEKTTMQESHGVYTFLIARGANKIDVKRAVQALYGVKAVKIRIVNTDGNTVRFGARLGRRSDMKKAIVTLAPGAMIDVHEGV